MIKKQKRKLKFDFDIRTLNSNNKKKYLKNNSNLKEINDIFIRKQDLYLIKLFEKRIKLIKMYKSKKVNNKINFINPSFFKNYHDENKIAYNSINKKINQEISQENNFKNIEIKFNKMQKENSIYNNYEKDKNNDLNHFDNLITSKIYNKDKTKNNKNMLKIINKDDKYNYDYNFKNLFMTKYNNAKSLIKLPKIKINNNNKKTRNYKNVSDKEDSFNNYKTIILKTKNNTINNSKILTETFQDIYKSGDNLAKKFIKDNYNLFYNERSISPIKSKKMIKIE